MKIWLKGMPWWVVICFFLSGIFFSGSIAAAMHEIVWQKLGNLLAGYAEHGAIGAFLIFAFAFLIIGLAGYFYCKNRLCDVLTESWESKLPRFADLASNSPPTDLEKEKESFFDKFGQRLGSDYPDGVTWKFYLRIEKRLQRISESQWIFFREKLAPYTVKRHHSRHWSQFHDTLYEVHAHEWLLCEKNAQNIEFVPETQNRKTPDLKATIDGRRILVEVKNINESEDGLTLWGSNALITVKHLMAPELCKKINDVYLKSIEQLEAERSSEGALMYFFLVYNFDLDFEPDEGPGNDFKRFLDEIEKEDYPIVYHRYYF